MPLRHPIPILLRRVVHTGCWRHCSKNTRSPIFLTSEASHSSWAIPTNPTSRSETPVLRALKRNARPQWQNNGCLRARAISTKPLPTSKSRAVRFLYRSFAYLGFFVLSCGTVVAALFIYDASTYKEDAFVGDIPVSEVALNPRRGGPKNLPIAEHFVDDDDTPDKRDQKHKPKLVILGTGWGSVALLKQLNPDDYHVTVVSPSNHFLFTPMLPSATVGTLELRSLAEPVRGIVAKVKGHFFQGMAEDIDFSNRLIEVSAQGCNGKDEHFYLPYDKLVIGVGES